MALIFYLSSLSYPPEMLPAIEWIPIDKVYHIGEYAGLGFLLARALVHSPPRCFPASPWTMALLASALYGASDEWHQSFVPERFPTVWDWIVDVLGGTLGVIIMYLYQRGLARKSMR